MNDTFNGSCRERTFQIVKYSLNNVADPNIAHSMGDNALHLQHLRKKDTKLIEFLLTNMSLTTLIRRTGGIHSPDYAYK